MSRRSSVPVAVALIASAYVAAQMLANIGSLKITEVAGFSMDAGTLIYPFTFTLRDLIHKVAGKRVSRAVIVAAAAINLFMAGFFWLVHRLPAVANSGPQTELFGAVLDPVWRIVFASIIAEVVSELVDTEVYSVWEHRFGEKLQWGRVLSSNAVSIPTDTVLFVLIAFAGRLSVGNLWEIFVTNVVVKWLVTLVSIPWIYFVRAPRRRGRGSAAGLGGDAPVEGDLLDG
jgi:uncharacterized integral membrane protein (TIGR00697 family)